MIDETLTNDAVSASTNPSVSVSDAVVEIKGPGCIFLECKSPSGDWISIGSVAGAFSISTADPALSYRFRAQEVLNNARVYFGP